MFALFKKHRILKLVGFTAGLFLIFFLLSPIIDMVKGQDIDASELLGSYSYGTEHYVDILTNNVGRMVSKGTTVEFTYTYDKGRIDCLSADKTISWRMRTVSDNAIFNSYDTTYLFKRNV